MFKIKIQNTRAIKNYHLGNSKALNFVRGLVATAVVDTGDANGTNNFLGRENYSIVEFDAFHRREERGGVITTSQRFMTYTTRARLLVVVSFPTFLFFVGFTEETSVQNSCNLSRTSFRVVKGFSSKLQKKHKI